MRSPLAYKAMFRKTKESPHTELLSFTSTVEAIPNKGEWSPSRHSTFKEDPDEGKEISQSTFVPKIGLLPDEGQNSSWTHAERSELTTTMGQYLGRQTGQTSEGNPWQREQTDQGQKADERHNPKDSSDLSAELFCPRSQSDLPGFWQLWYIA